MYSKTLLVAATLGPSASAFHLPTPKGTFYGNLHTTLACNVIETSMSLCCPPLTHLINIDQISLALPWMPTLLRSVLPPWKRARVST
jgi:hypothetical protein